MERKDLVRMAVDLHNKTPQGNYSLDEMNDILKKAVFGKDYEKYIKDGKVYEKVTEEEYAQHMGWRSYWKH